MRNNAKKTKKLMIAVFTAFLITMLLEVFVFNFSTFRSMGLKGITICENEMVSGEEAFYTQALTVNGPVKNVYADITVENGNECFVKVILTDEGNKYEYPTPEFVVCNGATRTRFTNI